MKELGSCYESNEIERRETCFAFTQSERIKRKTAMPEKNELNSSLFQSEKGRTRERDELEREELFGSREEVV